jgi:hypothetical protein
MLTRYGFRDDHGEGNLRLVLELDPDYMPTCFDTLFDWAMDYVEPSLRWVGWKLVSSEPVKLVSSEPVLRQHGVYPESYFSGVKLVSSEPVLRQESE